MQEINELVAAGKIFDAKKKFEAYADSSGSQLVERDYIQFLYDNRIYQDFKRRVDAYLTRYTDDSEFKQLRFDYYGKLASDAERREDYGMAMEYIVKQLLSPDNREQRKWETRQTTLYRKWYQQAMTKDDESLRKSLLNQMMDFGFQNLARDLDEELFRTLEETARAADQDGGEQ